VSIARINVPFGKASLAHPRLFAALARKSSLHLSSLRRSRSLPEGWRVSAFVVFDKPSPPPSPTPAPRPAKIFYMHGAGIPSVESLAQPLQSGRAYLQSILPHKAKTKTKGAGTSTARFDAPPVKAVPFTRTLTGTQKKPSLMSRLYRGEETKPQAKPATAEKWFSKVSKMSKATAGRMRILLKGAPNARELSWKDFLKVDIRLP
jgi:hypothetical protein